MSALIRHDESSLTVPGPEIWTLGFLEALRRYRRITLVGWLVASAGVAGLILRWSSPGVLGLADILVSVLTIAGGVLLVHYGIEALSGFIHTALAAMPREGFGELRELMEEVDRGGWQEAFAALRRLRRTGAGPITH